MDNWSGLLHNAQEICRHLFSSKELLDVLGRPEVTAAAFLVLTLVVFAETGLLVGFCLPGDSLLVTAGLVAYRNDWNLALLLGLLGAAAVVGDSVGYYIGFKSGPKIFRREKSLLFARDHLLKAEEFYERHGGKTIILARFMPILRTFAPVVAGVGRMEYRKFLFYNVFGGIGWVVSMVLAGFYLTRMIDPPLRALLDRPDFTVRDHIEKVILVVVLLSISPAGVAWVRNKLRKRAKPAKPAAVKDSKPRAAAPV